MADNGKKTGNWKRSRSNNEGQHGKKARGDWRQWSKNNNNENTVMNVKEINAPFHLPF